ncbi:MAG: hypothetical protein CSB47_11690 [Proteobacteria bacterium]|nr:MAG: hypothetical protein CSB47_11690 [Pseudomonadota bacterium]
MSCIAYLDVSSIDGNLIAKVVDDERSASRKPDADTRQAVDGSVEARRNDVAVSDVIKGYEVREDQLDFFGGASERPKRKRKGSVSTKAGAMVDQRVASGQVSIFDRAVTDRAREGRLPGEYATVTEYIEGREYKVPHLTVGSRDAAAETFDALLGMRSREALDVIILDKDNRLIAVQRMTTGTIDASSAYPGDIVKFLASVEGAASFYVGHNHPSGKSKLSGSDHTITDAINQYFVGLPFRFKGMFAVGESEYSHYSPATGEYEGNYPLKQTPWSHRFNPVEQEIKKRGRLVDGVVNSPQEAKEIAAAVSEGRNGIMFMDNRHRPTAFFPVDFQSYAKLSGQDVAVDVLAAASRSNAAAAILVDDTPLTGDYFKDRELRVMNFAALLDKAGVRALDVFSGGVSQIERGATLPTQEKMYSKSGATGWESTVQSVRDELSGKMRGLSLLEQTGKVSVVQSTADLPVQADTNAAGVYHKDKVYLVTDNIAKGEAYGVFLHEAGEHAGLASMLGGDKYAQVVEQFNRLLKAKNADAVRAAERVPGGTPSEHVASERLAYLVEDYTNHALKSGGAKMLVQRVIAAVKAWAMTKLPSWLTRKIKLTPADIQALAVRGARAWSGISDSIRTSDVKIQEKMSKRDHSPVSIPDVVIPYSLGELTSHPDYQAAKAGDTAAALSLAQELVTDDVANRIIDMVEGDSVLLPVLAEEAQGRNKIPLAIAKILQKKTGLLTELEVYQVDEVRRSGLSGLERIFATPEFDGENVKGKSFLLIDDTLTQGGTFASLASHITQNGGQVVGALALTGKQYSARLNLSSETLSKLRSKYGDLENDFIQATGYGFEALTNSEARYLANYSPSEKIRDYILEARDEAVRKRDGQAAGNLAKKNQSDSSDQAPPSEGLGRSGAKFSKKKPSYAKGQRQDAVKDQQDDNDSDKGSSLKESVKKILEGQRLREVYDKKTGEYRVEGVNWQDVAGLIWRRVSDIAAKAGERSLYLQSFNTLLDRNKKYFKRFAEESGHNPLEAIEEYKRLMNAVVQHWADRYQKAQDKYKALSAAQQKRVSMVMHDATMAGVHPDRDFVPDSSLQANGKRLSAADYIKRLQSRLAQIDTDQRRMVKNRAMNPDQALEESVKLKRQIKSLQRRIKHERSRRLEYERLKKRWEALSDAERNVYHAWNQELNKLWEKQQKAIEQKISEIKGMNAQDKAAAKSTLLELREEHRKQMELGPYFPLRRYGDYQLLVKRSDGEYERYHFERRSEALDVQARIKAEDSGVSVRLLTDYKDVGGQVKDVPGAAGRLLKMFSEENPGGVDPAVRETINRFVVNALPEVSARKAEMRRYFVTGASADMERSFAHAMLHGGHDLSRIMFSHKVASEVDWINDQVSLHESVAKGEFDDDLLKKQAAEDSLLIDKDDLVQVTQFLKVLRKQVDGMMNPDTNQIAAFSGNFAFFWYLAGSPGAAIANLTQVPQIAYPMMAARFGAGASRRELQRAYADIAKSMKPVSNVVQGVNPLNWDVRDSVFDAANAEHLSEEERNVLRALEMDSTTDTTQANSMASVASGDGKAKIGGVALKAEKVMALTGFWFHNAEVLNRQVVQLATYRLMQKADGKTRSKIERMHGDEGVTGLDMARWMTTRTQYDYSHSNRSMLLKSNLAKTLTPLMNYSFLTLELLFTRLRDMVNMENDPELRQMARKELMGIMGMTALMGGTRALPMMIPFMLINALFGGDEDEPFDAEAAWGEFLKDSFGALLGDEGGEFAANLVTRGAVNAMPVVGFDLSNRISMANLLFNDPDVAKEGGDTVKEMLVDMAGVNASTMVSFAEGFRLLSEGNTQRGLEKLLPKFVRDISKAQRYASEGVVSARGDTVVHRDDLSWYDVVLQSQGLSPSEVARTYDKRNAKRLLARRLELRRKGLMNRYARARMDGQGDIAEVLREIDEFNRVNRFAGISRKQLVSSVKRRRIARRKKSADAGLYIGDMYKQQLRAMGYE